MHEIEDGDTSKRILGAGELLVLREIKNGIKLDENSSCTRSTLGNAANQFQYRRKQCHRNR